MELIAQYYNEQKDVSVDVFEDNDRIICKTETFISTKACDRFLKERGYYCYRIIYGGANASQTEGQKN